MEPVAYVAIISGTAFTVICVGYVIYACMPSRDELAPTHAITYA